MAESPLFPNVRNAVSRLGHDAPGTLDEVTETADLAKDFHIQALEQCLSDYDWDFASTFAALQPAADDDLPLIRWGLKWKIPPDCVQIREVFAGDVPIQKHLDFQIGGKAKDKDGRFLMTDQSSISIRYTRLEPNPNNWDPNFDGVYEAKLREILAFPYTNNLRIEAEAEAKYLRILGRASGTNDSAGFPEKTEYDGISSVIRNDNYRFDRP